MENISPNLAVIFEHEDWLLLYKPEGFNFHSEDQSPGFVALAKKQFSMELWPVHRLDKDTSGLILLAKSQESCSELSGLFSNRRIEKYYLAITQNTLKKKQGKVIGDMTKSRNGSFKLLKTKENPAITQFISHSLMPGYRVCLLKPKTGKTHQLRVAMKSLSASIIGDKRYSGENSDRLYLHAFALRFEYRSEFYSFQVLPVSGDLFMIEAFKNAVCDWLAPWDQKWPK